MNLIVFDIDETLTSSDQQHKTAYLKAMQAIGVREVNQNWKDYLHHTDSYILKVNYEANFNMPFDNTLIDTFEASMMETMQSLKPVNAIKGAQQFVDYLRNEKQYAITFATGSLLQPAILKLQQAEIWHDNNLIAAANHLFEREQIVTEAIERAKKYYNVTSFQNIISIGDGIWDLKTAANLNLKFIGVGFKNYDVFLKAGLQIHTENWYNFNFENAESKLGLAGN